MTAIQSLLLLTGAGYVAADQFAGFSYDSAKGLITCDKVH
jgi:hypothetical protein